MWLEKPELKSQEKERNNGQSNQKREKNHRQGHAKADQDGQEERQET